MIDELLPIGSVIKIKDLNSPLMIIKVCKKEANDYIAVKHPIGFENNEKLIYFNRDKVEKIYFIGRINEEIKLDLYQKFISGLGERK